MDDEEDLEIAANPKDPNAPKPEGMVMSPSKGETLVVGMGIGLEGGWGWQQTFPWLKRTAKHENISEFFLDIKKMYVYRVE